MYAQLKKLLLVAAAAAVLLAACAVPGGQPLPTETIPPTVGADEPSGQPSETPEPTLDSGAAGGISLEGSLEALIEGLEYTGATVVRGGKVDEPFWPVTGIVLEVNGEQVQVFEFADEASREAASSAITAAGQPSPTMIVEWVSTPHFWASGRFIVLYVGENAEVIGQLTEALGEPIAEGEGGGMLPPEGNYPAAVMAALAQLAESQSLQPAAITVVEYEAVEWSDACLGVNRPGEMCAQVITPGYRIVLSANGNQYVFHTNTDGSIIRSAGL